MSQARIKDTWLDRAPLPGGVLRAARFVHVNEAFARLVGVPRDALLGQLFLDHVAPADRPRMGDRHERRLRGEQVPGAYEFQLLCADGSSRPVEVWISADEDGDVIFQLHDRTDRAVRQQHLGALARLGVEVQAEPTEEAVFAALAAGIGALGLVMVRLGPSGGGLRVLALSGPGAVVARIEGAAGGASELAGPWGPAAELAWRTGSGYVDDMPLAAATFFGSERAALARDLVRGAHLDRGVMIRVDEGGQPAQLLLLMASWLEPEDLPACRLFGAQVSAALSAARLFADLRRSYADLARAQEQLVERERLAALGELAAVVAHEVRNPLGVLFNSLGTFRRLLGSRIDGTARTLLEIMEEEAARLNHIVGNLLDFARPVTPARSRTRLGPVIEEAVNAALGDARGRVAVACVLDDLPPVPVDARLLRQAILNLAANAVQAMPTGGTLTVRLRRGELAGRPMACVDVTDTGPGIAPDIEPRIFEPFFTTRPMGTGLGLAVVKRIVLAHHGELRVSTAEGRGTTFTLCLPFDGEPKGGRPGGGHPQPPELAEGGPVS